VEHIDHWTNTPIALPDNHSLPQWQYTRTTKEMGITRHHQQTQMDKPKASQDIKQHQRQKPWSQHQRTLHQIKPKQVAITFSRHYRQHRHDDNTKDSHKSMKWQHQARPIIKWTRQHLDSFLALAEVACEWNIEPG
jgi:hypothetical protein